MLYEVIITRLDNFEIKLLGKKVRMHQFTPQLYQGPGQ